ncbi:uncharacterized protein TM35_000051410 [Trypanosoma theileri]|uniref:Uncharacterized protein n=1 Tax=Trypanosoma theileri TaxID=67003 RepID=A0A1X0P3U5_9TRYP|nr:uncharacterized protein TM35_000051410 [Trypanosoma theileri]ORC91545.1 hypothetical protein TM35_000051410 [Trypanosoma theileri]
MMMMTEDAEAQVMPPQLYKGSSTKLSEPVGEKEPFADATQQLTSMTLREVIDVQEETIRAIDRAERAMNTAENLGGKTKEQLAQDTVIIEVIDTTLAENESMLRRAKRDINWFRVQLQKDKLFLCLFVVAATLSVAAIIVGVVYKRRR